VTVPDHLRRRALLLFGLVTVLHLLVTVGLLLFVFGAGMARFDTGEAMAGSEWAAHWALIVLGVPLLTLLDAVPGTWFPRLWGYLPFVANAMIWGGAAVAIRKRL
jgi:hypothetical protein